MLAIFAGCYDIFGIYFWIWTVCLRCYALGTRGDTIYVCIGWEPVNCLAVWITFALHIAWDLAARC